MDAIETMMDEHRVILSALDALDGFRAELEAGADGAAAGERLARFVDFFANFADKAHHGKEEDLLFRAMADNGFPVAEGPIAVMLAEHDQGRALVGALRDAASGPADWDDDARAGIVDAARDFAAMLRSHIDKEDNVLYVMARNALPPDDMAGLDRACADLDAARAAEIDRLRALAAAL